MKTYWGVDAWSHVFLTSALEGVEWSASRPGCSTQEKSPTVPIVQETVWAPVQVWTIWRSENSWPYRDSKSDTSVSRQWPVIFLKLLWSSRPSHKKKILKILWSRTLSVLFLIRAFRNIYILDIHCHRKLIIFVASFIPETHKRPWTY
jgi:hypothetical protein